MENKLTSPAQNSFMANFEKSDDILKDMCGIIESSRDRAYKAVNTALIQRNWLIGYRIAEEEVKGADRAEYGLGVIKNLAKELTAEYGKGFTASIPSIRLIRRFSRQRLENLLRHFPGRTTLLCCR